MINIDKAALSKKSMLEYCNVVNAIFKSGLPDSSRKLIYCRFIKEVNNISHLKSCVGIDQSFDSILNSCYPLIQLSEVDSDIGC